MKIKAIKGNALITAGREYHVFMTIGDWNQITFRVELDEFRDEPIFPFWDLTLEMFEYYFGHVSRETDDEIELNNN